MEPEGSAPHSQQLSAYAYSEPDKSSCLADHEIASIYSHIILWRSERWIPLLNVLKRVLNYVAVNNIRHTV
jgi:hypothetical protein